MERHEIVAADAAGALDRALGGTSVRMPVRVEHREEREHCCCGGVVFVLTNGIQHLASALLHFGRREIGLHQDFSDELEHRLEMLRETRAADRHDVPVGSDAQRDAALVERFGDVVAASAPSASIEHLRREMAEARLLVRVVDAAGAHRDLDRDRRNGVGLLRDDGDPVVQHVPRRREALLNGCRH